MNEINQMPTLRELFDRLLVHMDDYDGGFHDAERQVYAAIAQAEADAPYAALGRAFAEMGRGHRVEHVETDTTDERWAHEYLIDGGTRWVCVRECTTPQVVLGLPAPEESKT